jgi:hypothetical protein
MPHRAPWIVAAAAAGIAAAVLPHALSRRSPSRTAEPVRLAPGVGMPGGPRTTADGLRDRIAEMESRLREHPADAGAAILLADALLRQARSTTNGRPANRAGDVLGAVLKDDPGQYDALRLLGAIHLSRHRFRDALSVARRARDERPQDGGNWRDGRRARRAG